MLKALRVATARRTGRAIKYLQPPRVVSEIGLGTVGSKLASFALPSEVEFLVSGSTTGKSDTRRLHVRVIGRRP